MSTRAPNPSTPYEYSTRAPSRQSAGVVMLLTEKEAEQRGREQGKGKNDISLIVPGAVAKLVKHFAATLSPLAFSHVISFHVCGAN